MEFCDVLPMFLGFVVWRDRNWQNECHSRVGKDDRSFRGCVESFTANRMERLGR